MVVSLARPRDISRGTGMMVHANRDGDGRDIEILHQSYRNS
jgi:hypothetical protein